MNSPCLTIVDTLGIQAYLFGSNRLRENTGASHLVNLATEGWLLSEAGAFLPGRHNIVNQARQDGLGSVLTGELQAELLYAGGGNTVILFREDTDAKAFATRLSKRLLTDAPGLEAVLIIEQAQPSEPLARSLLRAMSALASKKAARESSSPLLGLGVTAACRSTSQAANVVAGEPGGGAPLPISAEVKAKWDNTPPAKKRLRAAFGAGLPNDFDFPDEFDHLGRTEGVISYIAVVHADGNGMGKTLEGISKYYATLSTTENAAYVSRLRTFSDATKVAGQKAMQAVVDQVLAWNQSRAVEPHVEKAATYLSVRPLVFGGDDTTFVCDGRIGLKAAQVYLHAFSQQQIPDESGHSKPARAAAGVAIVKVHYPFARAYELAEALCHNAKRQFGRRVSALDWHLAQSGLFGELSEIRAREYDEKWQNSNLTKSLTMRPVSLTIDPVDGWRTWTNFTMLTRAFQSRSWPRNKVLELREALRKGPADVERFVSIYGRVLPKIDLNATEYPRVGWHGARCVYYDAIEMIEQEALS